MTDHDNELVKLAERVEALQFSTYANIESYNRSVRSLSIELRTLAEKGKAGGVPDGWGIEHHNGGYMVNPPDGPGCWVSDRNCFNVPLADQTLAKLSSALLADHSPGAGNWPEHSPHENGNYECHSGRAGAGKNEV